MGEWVYNPLFWHIAVGSRLLNYRQVIQTGYIPKVSLFVGCDGIKNKLSQRDVIQADKHLGHTTRVLDMTQHPLCRHSQENTLEVPIWDSKSPYPTSPPGIWRPALSNPFFPQHSPENPEGCEGPLTRWHRLGSLGPGALWLLTLLRSQPICSPPERHSSLSPDGLMISPAVFLLENPAF